MTRKILGAAVAAVLTATPVLADFPAKDMQGIIMWGAGGGTDVIMRAVTPHAEKAMGAKVVMQNMSGGVGAISVKYTYAQKADGYTLLMGAENPQLYKVMGLGDVDYADFIPISMLARGVPVIVAQSDAPFDNFREMVDYIEANPKTVKFGSTGPGGLPSVVNAMLGSQVNLDVTTVPYNGDGPAMTALQGGAIDVFPVVIGAALDHINAGRMKAIAVVDTEANPALPGVQPIVEDYAEYATYLPWGPFFGIWVKKDTPEEAVTTLQAAYADALDAPEFQAFLDQRGFTPMNIAGDEAQEYLDRWQSVSSWLVYESGLAKHSPEKFDIPRP